MHQTVLKLFRAHTLLHIPFMTVYDGLEIFRARAAAVEADSELGDVRWRRAL
jgi:hypothetical protein